MESAKKFEGFEEDYCLPSHTVVSRKGKVRIVFTRELVITDLTEELKQEIVESGAIQLSIIDESSGRFNNGDTKEFSWDIDFENRNEVVIQINFDDPGAISSSSNDKDKLRILFVDTSSFIQCESIFSKISEKSDSERNKRVLDQGRDTIPPNYQVITRIPP